MFGRGVLSVAATWDLQRWLRRLMTLPGRFRFGSVRFGSVRFGLFASLRFDMCDLCATCVRVCVCCRSSTLFGAPSFCSLFARLKKVQHNEGHLQIGAVVNEEWLCQRVTLPTSTPEPNTTYHNLTHMHMHMHMHILVHAHAHVHNVQRRAPHRLRACARQP